MILYQYSVNRNKNEVSQGKLKHELLISKDCRCYLCGEKKFVNRLQLEHIFPVMLGGNIVDKSNLDLACVKCHCIKTTVDRKIIHGLKALGIIHGAWTMESLWSLEQLKKFYLENFSLIKDKLRYDKWELNPERITFDCNRRTLQ